MIGAGTMMSSLAGLIGFVVLFACAVLLLRWLQRRCVRPTTGGGDKAVRVIRRVPLNGHTMLLVVQIGAQQYALTSSRHNGTQVIDRLDTHLSEQDSSFSGLLATAFNHGKNTA